MISMSKQIPAHIFRGYDVRGLVGEELDSERVEILGRAYATWLLKRRIYDCVVGYDCRLSSPEFRDAVVKALTVSGITVYDIGLTLSQIVYFAQYYFKTRGMVMITASHNPKEYNGFKFGTGFSETMIGEEILELKNLVERSDFLQRLPTGRHIQRDIFGEYADDLFGKVGETGKFKVVVDACFGTAGLFLPKILRRAGCEVIEQNTVPDGTFPAGTPDPTEQVVQKRVSERVLKEGVDLGFSYDVDGDRLGVVDKNGCLIWDDALVALLAKDILDFIPGAKIVYNALCSKQVEEVIKTAGGVPVIEKTGRAFIEERMRKERAVFGGELSGHFFFADNFYGHDDSAVATLRLLAYLTRTGKSLHETVAALPHYFSSPEIKLGCNDTVKFSLVEGPIADEVKKLFPMASYTEIDGVRMDTKDEMLIIRASQNGPYLTVKFEAKDQGRYEILKGQVGGILKKFSEIDYGKGVNLDSLESTAS